MMNFITKLVRSALVFLLAIFGLMHGAQAQAATITRFVDASAATGGNGLSWSTAYKYLQDGIAYAITQTPTNDVVLKVAQGTYKPDQGSGHTAGTETDSFQLNNNVSIMGGYNGESTNPDLYDPETYITILSGDISADGTDSYHVVTAGSGTDLTAIIDGCRITGGAATGTGTNQDKGGGIFIDTGRPKIRGCTITYNTASDFGGGIACVNNATAPEIRNCMIDHNAVIDTISFGTGGGVSANYKLTLVNTTFFANTADSHGGGLSVAYTSNRTDVKVINCRFVANEAEYSGGGIFTLSGNAMVIINGLFNANIAGDDGGGVSWTGPAAVIKNCTFVNCEATGDTGEGLGGGLSVYSPPSGSVVTNCIFRNNTGGAHPDILSTGGGPSNLVVTYSSTDQTSSGATFGTGVIHVNPNFVDPNGDNNILGDLDDNYRLACPSDCINKGLDSAVPADTEDVDEDDDESEETPDLDLHTRLVGVDLDGDVVDMGAYEVATLPTCTADIVPYGPCKDGVVNIDDLLAVILAWGTCPSSPTPCPADIANADGEVNIDDLLAVITGWSTPSNPCVSGSQYNAGSLSSVEDCMDAASEVYEPYSTEWDDSVNRCVAGLCAAEIIECD